MIQSYAAAVTAANEDKEKIVDVLWIVLKKTKTGASYLSIVFMSLGILRDHVVGIDQADFRTILVHLNCLAGPWTIEVRDGLITLPMRMFRRLTKVRIMGVGVQTDAMEVVDMLKNFGSFEENFQIKETRYFEGADMSKLTIKKKMLKGVKDGDREVQMYIIRAIPSFCLLENGKRVRVWYPARPITCARCHQGIRGCKGGGNAAKCEKNGREQVPLAYW